MRIVPSKPQGIAATSIMIDFKGMLGRSRLIMLVKAGRGLYFDSLRRVDAVNS